jgi:hypothetical protein
MKRIFFRSEEQTFDSSHLPVRDIASFNFENLAKIKINLELTGASLYQVIASFRKLKAF